MADTSDRPEAHPAEEIQPPTSTAENRPAKASIDANPRPIPTSHPAPTNARPKPATTSAGTGNKAPKIDLTWAGAANSKNFEACANQKTTKRMQDLGAPETFVQRFNEQKSTKYSNLNMFKPAFEIEPEHMDKKEITKTINATIKSKLDNLRQEHGIEEDLIAENFKKDDNWKLYTSLIDLELVGEEEDKHPFFYHHQSLSLDLRKASKEDAEHRMSNAGNWLTSTTFEHVKYGKFKMKNENIDQDEIMIIQICYKMGEYRGNTLGVVEEFFKGIKYENILKPVTSTPQQSELQGYRAIHLFVGLSAENDRVPPSFIQGMDAKLRIINRVKKSGERMVESKRKKDRRYKGNFGK